MHVIIKGMKKVFLFLLICLFPVVSGAYIERNNAVVRIMSKDAGKVQEYVVPVGGGMQFEKLKIDVRSCKQSDPFQAENFFAFMEIYESDKGQIFGGWMNRNEPGQNPLQHADYDLWLVRCE